jgi:hypothetical protein
LVWLFEYDEIAGVLAEDCRFDSMMGCLALEKASALLACGAGLDPVLQFCSDNGSSASFRCPLWALAFH